MDKLKMSGGEGDEGTGDGDDHTEDDLTQPDGEHGREVMLSVVMPHKVGDDTSQVTEHQIIWMPASSGVPQPPTLYSIKQLNYSQEAATSTQSASSDSNDSCDEKMMITIAGDDQDVGDNSN